MTLCRNVKIQNGGCHFFELRHESCLGLIPTIILLWLKPIAHPSPQEFLVPEMHGNKALSASLTNM